MRELWSPDSYELRRLSLPIAVALAALVVVIAYAVVMRGASRLRAWFLLHSFALLPYTVALTLAPSIRSPAAAAALFRLGGACIPLSAAAGTGFQLTLAGATRRWRAPLAGGVALSLLLVAWGVATPALVAGARWLPAGLWFASAGPRAWVAVVATLAFAAPGFAGLAAAARRAVDVAERQQLRRTLAANLLTAVGLVDLGLAYGYGSFPVGWILIGAGGLLTLRALVFEDLLRVRAVDALAPQLVTHAAGGILLAWAALVLLGPGLPWWGGALAALLCFASVRVALAVLSLVNRGGRRAPSTLTRLADTLVERARGATAEEEVAALAADVVELGLGARPAVLLAEGAPPRWTTVDGHAPPDAAIPDDAAFAWLRAARAPVFADELELRAPEALRPPLRALCAAHGARAVVALAGHDEALGLLVLPAAARPVRGRELAFLAGVAERLAEALRHVRAAARAAARDAVAREVDLAATVQARLLPRRGPHRHGAIEVVGSWRPASQCGGDFWCVHPLADDQVLVAIGDVTGHGVASAMVTAAAAGACDVATRAGGELDLARLVAGLDAAVHRIGGGDLAMTCAAAILDPRRGELRYVSCGHPAGYLLRAGPRAEVQLHALAGRGNPLGAGLPVAARLHARPLAPGDTLCWYTDGLTEVAGAGGDAYGDRRLQRLLRRLDPAQQGAAAVHDAIYDSAGAHRGGRPRLDDQTLVIAHLAPGGPA